MTEPGRHRTSEYATQPAQPDELAEPERQAPAQPDYLAGPEQQASEQPEYVAEPDQAASDADPVDTPAALDERHREELSDIGRPPPRWKALLLTPTNGVWAGLVVVAAGFSAIFYSWGAVAGTLNVDEQMASLIASGFIGLGLVVAGVAAVDIAVRLQDRPERQQQFAQVDRSVAELRAVRDGRARSAY